ncbi:MAG TPA: response regulator, partial [Blastocatellia bacterium]
MMVGPKSILIADDDRFVREFLRIILTKAGYKLFFAEDGLTAVEMAATLRPDLVLTDGLLPKLHGFEVCKSIKTFKEPPKVVILSGVYTKPTYRCEAAREFLADALLCKPIDSVELLACIELQ